VLRGVDVDFHKFWMEKWTEVPFPSFFILQIPPMIKMKIQ
jgi:hypothetical protein